MKIFKEKCVLKVWREDVDLVMDILTGLDVKVENLGKRTAKRVPLRIWADADAVELLMENLKLKGGESELRED